MSVARLLDTLRPRLGRRLLTSPAELAVFGSDALTAFHERPAAVVLAESADEVVGCPGLPPRGRAVRCARQRHVAVGRVAAGRRRGGGRAQPPQPGACGSTPTSELAVVEPGVINLDVSRAALEHGLMYCPDPSSQSVCTIGGNLAFNSGGAHCLRHGMTANHVLGLRAVLPDGEVVELGGDSLEPAGPDLAGMFCGSEGLFGIALEVTVRLVPIAEATHTALAVYGSLEQAGDAVAQIVAAGLLPVAMEIMDALAMEAAEASVKPGYPQGAALLIVELEGERAVVDAGAVALARLLRASGAGEVVTTEDPDERALIWKGRKSAFSAVGWLAPDYLVQDGVVPRTRLGEALAEIDRMSAAAGIRVANVFHAGDGNLHPLILFDGREPGMLERAEALAGDILRLCIRLGGSITGEHGVGVEKRDYLALQFAPADLAFMRRVRAAVDPAALANPGKMLVGA
ncbi:MAG: FAD-linked oxidase C-terminal domain-containing protein [Solirubrobacterales bacterium]